MSALRDHGDGDEPHYRWLNGAMAAPCMHAGGVVAASQTTASWVSDLRPGLVRHWVTGTAAPCVGLFKPVRVEDPLDLGAPPTDRADSHSLWWRHERLHRQVMRDPARLRPLFAAERDAVEARWRAQLPQPSAAFAEGDRLLADWTVRVEAAAGPDTRPRAVRRYWRVRDERVWRPAFGHIRIRRMKMLKLRVCALAATFIALFGARAQADGPPAPALTDEQQVIATETEWVQAEIHRDASALDRVLDDRFLFNSKKGPPRNKASVIADTLRWNMLSQTITDRTVLVDGDTAVVFGTANFRFAVEGKDDEVSSGRYTTAYIRRDGRWRALALQMTALGTAAPAGPPAASPKAGNAGGEETAVLAAMDRYLTAVSARDLDAMASLQTPDGMTYRARAVTDGGMEVVGRSNAYWVDPARKDGRAHRERYWAPTVLVRGSIAVVWAPYEYWIDGKTSHCGIDAFSFVKTGTEWRVANAMWTVEPDACPNLRPSDAASIRPAG